MTMLHHNILFLLSYGIDPELGGTERVCANLAHGFIKDGHNVYSICSWIDRKCGYTDSFEFEEPKIDSERNIHQLETIVKKYKINYFILAVPQEPWLVNAIAPFKGRVKLICHYHNSPIGLNSLVERIRNYKLFRLSLVRRLCFEYNRIKRSRAHQKLADTCDKLVMLSSNFENEICKLANFDKNKLVAIPNIVPSPTDAGLCNKKKQIVYVGRISEEQKRIHSLLNIWGILSKQIPEWSLKLVGGGEIEEWKDYAERKNLKNIEFCGFQNPNNYYKESQFLFLTSTYEGFGLVLVEAMNYGCIPFAFSSFASVHDVITDGVDGILVKPFSEKEYAEKVLALINDKEKINSMQLSGLAKTKKFSEDVIISQWYKLFDEIVAP